MNARVLRFPLPAQAPIRLLAPAVDPGINWVLIASLALNKVIAAGGQHLAFVERRDSREVRADG